MSAIKINIIFHSKKEVRVKDLSKNIGIGGTEFAVLLLANELGADEAFEVNLIALSNLTIGNEVNFRIMTVGEMDCSLLTISCESYLNFIRNYFFNRLIVWIHHPNLSLVDIGHRCCAERVEFVGLTPSQFNGNALNNSDLHIINPLHKYASGIESCKERSLEFNKPIRFGFIGALTPQKGFHHVLSYWNEVKSISPDSVLRVFGSGSLYQDKDMGNIIPCDPIYEKKLLRINSCKKTNIEFHGLVRDLNDYLGEIDIGLLNPFASAEAYPDSILKFYEYGIPVISGMFNGSADLLRATQNIQFPNMMPLSAVRFLMDPKNYETSSKKIIKFMQNKPKNYEIIADWKRLLIEAKEGKLIRAKVQIQIDEEGAPNFFNRILNLLKFRYKYTIRNYLR
jgi:glycosyltransferase involved in cell wall biosynthesis